MKPVKINLAALFVLFLNLINESSADAPPLPQESVVNNQQSVISTCHATRAVMGHDGEIAQWKAKCKVEVWTDKDQPDFKDLSFDQRNKIMAELGDQPSNGSSETPGPDYKDMFDKSKYLAEEAVTRHNLCMEAKRSILWQLKSQLPAGITDCNKITEVINNLKLTPELEAFIGKVDGPMKELVAKIHSIEQDNQLEGAAKMEALRDVKTQLTVLLDENCKDDHPSIRYHNVSYMPHPELDKVKMTLVISRPGKRIETFNLPEDSYGPHVEYLRGLTDAAAHHGQITGQSGMFDAIYQHGKNDIPGGLNEAPGVISIVPTSEKNELKEFGSSISPVAASDSTPKSVSYGKPDKTSRSTSIETQTDPIVNDANLQAQSPAELSQDERKNLIVQNFIKSVNTLGENGDYSAAFEKLFSDESLNLVPMDNSWFANNKPSTLEELGIELTFNKKKALLDQALNEGKIPSKVYDTGLAIISKERDEAKRTQLVQDFVNTVKSLGENGDYGEAFKKLFSDKSLELVPEKDDYKVFSFWYKSYKSLAPDQKRIEITYQKKKELLAQAVQTVEKIDKILSKKISEEGKKIIKNERKQAREDLNKNSMQAQQTQTDSKIGARIGNFFNSLNPLKSSA